MHLNTADQQLVYKKVLYKYWQIRYSIYQCIKIERKEASVMTMQRRFTKRFKSEYCIVVAQIALA